ncbi:TerC family protein [Caulobacter sp. 17J65-9]|uniref:TerC family protein n=1 Tax=Caulobacter sp. 17J65-9 TaxID=2709382 RepID=UPI0013C6C4F0|nr:TerC family protein [Caulobacter sp. 17J65-9]NEX92592.1 TerC family protein [Caulobacter sp. 17J65-9]
MTDAPLWLWVGFNAFILILLAFDLGVFHRKAKVVGMAEALWLSAAYLGLALLFNLGVLWLFGPDKALEFFTGYLIERALSLDNVFVIALVFSTLAIPAEHQHRILFWGVLGALVMRGLMIWGGVALVTHFHWILYVFGAFLVFTGIKLLRSHEVAPDLEDSRILKFARRRLRVTPRYDGQKFFLRDRVIYATPLFLALVMVEAADLMFAVDSIPAIFAVTEDPFIVYTSNVFAILGLRALYFALARVLDRFVYLNVGLALVLVLIGAKMLLAGVWKMPVALALVLIVGILGGAIVASVLKTRKARPNPSPSGLSRGPMADGERDARR